MNMSASNRNRLARLFKVVAFALYGYCFAGTTFAAVQMSVPDSPLFLNVSAKPNLIMAIDDSGSMDGEVLLPTNDGAAWWRRAAVTGCTGTGDGFKGCYRNTDATADQQTDGQLNFNVAGAAGATWKKFVFLFPNGYENSNFTDRRRYADNADDHFAILPVPEFAWSRSAEYNGAYFDPAETYLPWPDGGGYNFRTVTNPQGNSPPTAARFDPVFTNGDTVNNPTTINLTRYFAGKGNTDNGGDAATCINASMPGVGTNYYFRVYTGMTIPEGACIRRSATQAGEWTTDNWAYVRDSAGCRVGVTNGCLVKVNNVDGTRTMRDGSLIAIRYFPATFYSSSQTALPGYTTSPPRDGKSPGDSSGTSLYRYEIKPSNFAGGVTDPDYLSAIKNFANWFTYYRKRHIALRAGLGTAFNDITGMRIGGFKISSSEDATMRDIDTAANRTSLYTDFYRNWTAIGGTPNKDGVNNILRNFQRTDVNAPITASCQRNYGMLFTDGFSNPGYTIPASGAVPGNVDGTGSGYGRTEAPYTDDVSDTMADIAMKGYVTRLRTEASLPAGRVVTPPQCGTDSQTASMDCNNNLHMNFFAITLGARGILFNPDASPAQNPYTTPPTWPTTFPARHPSAVDDLWHATINGRGQLLNAAKASELATKLGSVLNSIASAEGSASAAAVNSGSINSETRVFQASFSTTDWTGLLKAYPVNSNGTIDFASMVRATVPGTRQILTNTPGGGTGTGVPFRWDALDPAQQAIAGMTSGLVSYIRGNRLGDIVNSAPTFVGKPPFRYPDNLLETVGPEKPYSEFVADNRERTNMLYVGANDGMLHAFSVATGRTGAITEQFAYIPGAVYNNLNVLDDPPPAHKFFVDGTPSVVDAFFDDEWHSVLIGGLNKGGKGIYALDVTNPTAVNESSADTKVLWEITNATSGTDAASGAGFSDLGYTFSRPTIARLKMADPYSGVVTGKWVAIFGNGYDSGGTGDVEGKAVLFIVDVENGNLLRAIDVSTTPVSAPSWRNGLSTPAVVDLNGDSAADFVYAGDLYGRMWKFDLRATTPEDWDVAYRSGDPSTGTPVPLFTSGTTKPITVRPQVGPGPRGSGMVVLFGTGKYLELGDKNNVGSTMQTFYGIYDANTAEKGSYSAPTIAGGDLLQQTVTYQGNFSDTLQVRVVSANAVTDERGWYLNLAPPAGTVTGERQVSDPVLRNGRVVFTTLIPSTDECAFGGSSWLMDIDALSGGRTPYVVFDLDDDGAFDDLVDVNNDGVGDYPASGIRDDEIMSRPAYVAGQDSEFAYTTDTGGDINRSRINPGPAGVGRQSWRQLR
jgi:type IV pilus assembly protein PilY1